MFSGTFNFMRYMSLLALKSSALRVSSTMASADFLCDIPSPHGVGSRSITQDLPEYDALLSRFTCRIYIVALRTCIWTLSLVALLSSNDASYPLPVRQASVLLSTSFRPLVTKTPLPSRYSLPHVGLERWTCTTSSAPCRAHRNRVGASGLVPLASSHTT